MDTNVAEENTKKKEKRNENSTMNKDYKGNAEGTLTV